MQQWQFFRIPVNNADAAVAELNRFLRGARVLAVHREFVAQGESSYWALAVEFLHDGGEAARREKPARQKIDYREALAPEEFVLFARLREWRKAVGESEGVPVYTLLTNEQMAEIARRRCASKAALSEIDGIGKGRIEKYGDAVLALVQESPSLQPSPTEGRG